MTDTAHTILTSSCPITADVAAGPCCRPSQWLTAGFAPIRFDDGSSGWQRLAAHEVTAIYGRWASIEDIATFYRRPATGALLKRLTDTFEPFFALTRQEWEADLRSTANPITILYLWETVADVFDYYTKGKHFSVRGRREYFETLWLFFNHGAEAAGFEGRRLHSLRPDRVKRVAVELEQYFSRRKPSRRYACAS